MGKKERERATGGRPCSLNATSGVFLASLPAENRTERTEQTAPGSHEGATPRSRREGKRPSPQDRPGRPRGPRAPGPPARPRAVSLVPADRDPRGGRTGCCQPLSWGRGSRGGAQEQRPQRDPHPQPPGQPPRPKLHPAEEQARDRERQTPPCGHLPSSRC